MPLRDFFRRAAAVPADEAIPTRRIFFVAAPTVVAIFAVLVLAATGRWNFRLYATFVAMFKPEYSPGDPVSVRSLPGFLVSLGWTHLSLWVGSGMVYLARAAPGSERQESGGYFYGGVLYVLGLGAIFLLIIYPGLRF